MKTRRWTRSPRGEIFGVVTGLAEWRELNPGMTRLIVLLLIIFTGIFPGGVIYLLLALILPVQTKADIIDGDDPIDVTYEEAEEDDNIKKEYENLRKKAEEMEERIRRKEKDWDERFRKGE